MKRLLITIGFLLSLALPVKAQTMRDVEIYVAEQYCVQYNSVVNESYRQKLNESQTNNAIKVWSDNFVGTVVQMLIEENFSNQQIESFLNNVSQLLGQINPDCTW